MKKVIFNLSDEQDARLTKLAKRMGMSKSEALRQAIELYHIFREAQKKGDEIRKRNKDGEETLIQIL